MNGAERFNIRSPSREKDGGGDDLEHAPTLVSERRVKTPVRPPASKRRSVVHDEEPDTKRIILGDMSDEGEAGDVDIGDGIDVDSIQARREDEIILHRAVLGENLHDVYSNKHIKLAIIRNDMENLNEQLLSTDITEIFSPERVTAHCKKYGLSPGAAMDIKSGYDFDLAADRKRCWETIRREEPTLVIGSPPCTLF